MQKRGFMILQLKILQFFNFAILQFYNFTILQCLQCRNFTILMMISQGGGCQCGRREEDFMILKFTNFRIYFPFQVQPKVAAEVAGPKLTR